MYLATFTLHSLDKGRHLMEMNEISDHKTANCIGFHYFQDTTHYTNRDLATWLPELSRLSASWLILLSDATRAIPEQFIAGLINTKITPIVHFPLCLPDSPTPANLKAILEAYARWGIKFVVFFDKPNDSLSWSNTGWSHQDLVERFIDQFLPLALEAARIGLTPVFPPLQPGGSYWDTTFFKAAIQSLQRRGQQALLKKMAVAVYAYTFGHELSWGSGGSEKWPQTKPYNTPPDSQDQRGFNNFIWIQSIAKALGIKNLPVILFGAGIKDTKSFYSPEVHAEIVQSMIKLVHDDASSILACNFWVLAAEPASEEYSQAWIKTNEETLPVVRILAPAGESKKEFSNHLRESKETTFESKSTDESHPIAHYLLLPTYEWGVADWHLDVIRPFIRKYQPTVGFSMEEAILAKKVTVIGGEKSFSAEVTATLREAGCLVDQIIGDGTSIATQLIER